MASKIVCPKCKGTGKVYNVDWLGGVLTFGIGLLSDLSSPRTCDTCRGKGWIYNGEED